MVDFATFNRLKMNNIGTYRNDGSIVHDEIYIGENKYDFMAGLDAFKQMLLTRFPTENHTKQIENFIEKVNFVSTDSYKECAKWFFRLKAPGFLPSWLRMYLQKVLG